MDLGFLMCGKQCNREHREVYCLSVWGELGKQGAQEELSLPGSAESLQQCSCGKNKLSHSGAASLLPCFPEKMWYIWFTGKSSIFPLNVPCFCSYAFKIEILGDEWKRTCVQLLLVVYMSFSRKLIQLQCMLPALIPALFHTGSSSLAGDTLCSHLLALLAVCLLLLDSEQNS